MQAERSPRLALFVPTLDGGGAERVMVRLANTFASRGILVDLLLARAVGAWLDKPQSRVRVLELGGRGVLASLPALIRYMRRTQPTALLSTLDHANLIAVCSRIMAQTGTRVVVRQASDSTGIRSSTLAEATIDLLMGPSYRHADHVIVLADAMRHSLIRSKRLDPEKVSVIANPVSIDEIRDLAKQDGQHPWLANTLPNTAGPLIVAAGRLQPQKDFPTLLRAVATIAQHSPVRLAVLGDGPDLGALVSLAAELSIDNVTLFPGFQPNPYPWLAQADVVVLSSRFEGMPNVLLEALALGRPVVATDCPTGPHEVLAAGKFGKLVPVGDAAAMASAIVAVLAGDRPSADVLRSAASAYGLEGIATKYLDILFSGAGFRHAA